MECRKKRAGVTASFTRWPAGHHVLDAPGLKADILASSGTIDGRLLASLPVFILFSDRMVIHSHTHTGAYIRALVLFKIQFQVVCRNSFAEIIVYDNVGWTSKA